jgi:hypothetical protein
MAWMISGLTFDRDPSISAVRDAICRLNAGKDSHAGYCRALPLHRLFAHGKIKIFSSLTETIEAIKTYPRGDRYRVESFARNAHGSMLVRRATESPDVFKWSKSFWRSNLALAPCRYE